MSTPPTTPANDDDHHWARSVMERQVAVLGELAEDGLEIAKALKAEITEARRADMFTAPTRPADDLERLNRAWDRAARAVRLSLLLQARIVREIDELDREATGASGAAARKARVHQIIRRIVDRERPHMRQTMERMTLERLDRDFCGDLLDRPISELVELICRDLNLKPHWPTLVREPWAQAEIEAGRPGWPLSAYAETQGDDTKGDDALQRQPANALAP